MFAPDLGCDLHVQERLEPSDDVQSRMAPTLADGSTEPTDPYPLEV